MKRFLFFVLNIAGCCCTFAQNADRIDTAKENKDSINNVFTLGEVTVTANKSSPIFDSVSSSQMQLFAKNNVTQALNMLPGITLSEIGPRNEGLLDVRGFDLIHVPLLIDGIPVYVPYNGYVDLTRFTTFDISEIQVSKDYTSVNYGPNSMGGAINIITRKPVKPFEFNGFTGWQTGGYVSSFNIGSNLGRFYIEVGVSKDKKNYFPLSHDFVPTKYQKAGHAGNSNSDDEKVNFKIAYKPKANAQSEYALMYLYQHGVKGNPLYAGSDSLNSMFSKPRYWQWPKWDKQSIYFLSNTVIDNTQSIRTRIYYDQFINTLNSYDDSTFSTMKKPYAFSSLYNDYSIGAIVEYLKNFSDIDNIDASVQYKRDVHREHDLGDPVATMSDATYTAAIENSLKLSNQLYFLTGVSFNNRTSLKAQDYDSDTKTFSNFPHNSNNAVNIQGALQYNVDSNNVVSFSVARKTRFATTQNRYSYSLGTALPNPDLKAEYAVMYDLWYKGSFLDNKLKLNAAAFYSNIYNTILSVDNVELDTATGIELSQLQNVGKSKHEGFELGAQYRIAYPFLIGLNYTFIKQNDITDPTIFLTDVPRSKLFGFVEYSLKDIFTVQVNGEADSKRYSTSYGTINKGYDLFNANVRAHIWKWFSAEVGVNNIFDKNYSLTEGYWEPGRNYFANLIYRL